MIAQCMILTKINRAAYRPDLAVCQSAIARLVSVRQILVAISTFASGARVEWIRGIPKTLVLRDPFVRGSLGREAGGGLGQHATPGYLNDKALVWSLHDSIGGISHFLISLSAGRVEWPVPQRRQRPAEPVKSVESPD